MAEANGLIHIDRYGFRVNCRITVEEDGGFGIDESLDKPGRGDTINSWPWACDPGTVLIFHFGCPPLAGSLLRGHRMFRLVDRFFRLYLELTFEKINLDNLFKPPFQAHQLCSESLSGRFELLTLSDERRVVGFALFAELLFEHVGRKIIDRLDLKHGGLSLES